MAQVRNIAVVLKILVYTAIVIDVRAQSEVAAPEADTVTHGVHQATTAVRKKPKPLTTDEVVSDDVLRVDDSVEAVGGGDERTFSAFAGDSDRPEQTRSDSSGKRNSSSSSSSSSHHGNISVNSPAAQHDFRPATSLAGYLLLLLISVVIAGSLFVMLLCFVHKWRENMGTARYPSVVYSMLRQNEDEPEDVLGEILINIGLASPDEARNITPTSSDSSETSQDFSDHEVDVSEYGGSKFTTIPLQSDESTKRLMDPECDESDEELLQ